MHETTSTRQDRLALVTGGTSGIGLATSRGLADMGYRVVLTGRDESRARAIASEIPGATGMSLDLSSMASVRRFADAFMATHDSLDILLHNAGACFPKRVETVDGFEAQFAILYLGPYLLTELLLDGMVKPPARLIHVVSELHRAARLDLNDLQATRSYNFLRAYRKAELAKIMRCYSLARRLGDQGVKVNCLHPGGVRSQLFRHFKPPLSWLISLSSLLKMSPENGARNSLFVATDPNVENGVYYVNRKPKKSSKLSYRLDLQEQLGERTRALLGL